jgi:FMN-dependent oxidoreductase (nitrilotriacetate monooxygenase family)
MKLGMFYWNCGHHIAAWRHPGGYPDSGYNLPHLIELAQLSERGLFDMFFMADSVTFWRGTLDAMTRDSYCTWIEPFTLMASLAQHTKHIGLVCTATSTYEQPYFLARRFASLDLASGGRAGWNLVTAGSKYTADSFGYPQHVDKAVRYRIGREFAHVVRGLWNSWGGGVWVQDKASGVYFDPEKMHVLEHEGEFFKVRGPLNVPASPQGEPVMVQAGASEDGRALAAETAEVVFGASQTLARAQEFYADIKRRAAAFGRDPGDVKIMPGLSVSVAPTRAEAEAKFERLHELIDPKAGLELLSERMDHDLAGCDVDGYLPEIPITDLGGSRAELIVEMARRENMTIKDLYRHFGASRGHKHITGTPAEVADMMEEWVTAGGCDGFNIMPPLFPSALEDFVNLVVPELQRRGLYRTAYEGTTLRENLGITRPSWSPEDLERSLATREPIAAVAG